MREIKFRVFDGAKMVEDITVGKFGTFYVNPENSGLNKDDSACISQFNTKYPDDIQLMQFTGMKDKHGFDIYEGDILKSHHFFDRHRKEHFIHHIVKWSEKHSGWFLLNVNAISEKDGSVQLWVGFKSCEFSIVGNIHQNPELLS